MSPCSAMPALRMFPQVLRELSVENSSVVAKGHIRLLTEVDEVDVKARLDSSPPCTLNLRLLSVLFFFSGASSLIFETIFTRLLRYTFGNTAHAVSTVLAAFLGGLALGAYLLGRWVDRRPPSLWIYGVLELLVGIYCLFIPRLFSLLTLTYVAAYHALGLGPTGLSIVRFVLAAFVIVIPTFLMGGTLPVLARLVAAARPHFEPDVNRLYALNTLGAALGTLASTYLLMPSLGVGETLAIACGINFAIFLCVAIVASRLGPGLARTELAPSVTFSSEGGAVVREGSNAFLLLAALLTGFVALAYEVVWTHALSFLIGNTVYAFGVMLFTFLCGLGWGAQIVSNQLRRPGIWAPALAASQFLLGLAIFLTLPLWNRVPDAFAQGFRKAFELDLISIAFLVMLRSAWVAWKIYRSRLATAFPWLRAAELLIEVLFLAPGSLGHGEAGGYVCAGDRITHVQERR